MPPKHEPTHESRQLVQVHATVGTTQETISDILGIDSKTLRLHYRAELDQSLAKANASVGGALFNKAKGGDTAAMIFWMKTRAGWKETSIVQGPGPDGEHLHKIEDTGHRDALAHILARQAAAGTTDGGAGSTD